MPDLFSGWQGALCALLVIGWWKGWPRRAWRWLASPDPRYAHRLLIDPPRDR